MDFPWIFHDFELHHVPRVLFGGPHLGHQLPYLAEARGPTAGTEDVDDPWPHIVNLLRSYVLPV